VKTLSPEALQHCLDNAQTITFSTTNPNGTIHTVPVWYAYDGEAFWVITGTAQRKTKNLRRDPRVSLMLLVEQVGERPTEIALVYGTATIHEPAVDELRAKAFSTWSRYGEEIAREYAAALPESGACVLEIKPDKIVSWHPA
jgi:PPOX class probable F420-dependent enzyme